MSQKISILKWRHTGPFQSEETGQLTTPNGAETGRPTFRVIFYFAIPKKAIWYSISLWVVAQHSLKPNYSIEIIIGVDINEVAIERCKEKIDFQHETANGKVYLQKGDARHLDFINDGSIDLICTHPPYANIIQYSEGLEGDLSLFNAQDFLEEMKKVAQESYRVLKKDKFCAILMGDIRKKGFMFPLSFEVMKIFQESGFKLKETIIKEQHNCKATGYWKTNSLKYNFLLIAHEYLFVFKK